MAYPFPRSSISREGWYYLLVMTFIIGGAISRDVNLLYILAGMMIGPVLFNWRWVTIMLRQLRLERELPDRLQARANTVCRLHVHNELRFLDAWSLVVEEELLQIEPIDQASDAPHFATAFIAVARATSTATGEYHVRFEKRGKYQLGPSRIRSRFPLGLIYGTVRFSETLEVVVHPPLGILSPRFESTVAGRQTGIDQSRRQAAPAEGDFYGLREWRTGDSRRWIHWRTSAKTGDLAVRQFEQTSNSIVAVMLDLWRPQEATSKSSNEIELAVSFVATFVHDQYRKHASRIQVMLAGETHHLHDGPVTQALCRDVFDDLACLSAASDTRLRTASQRLANNNERDGRVLVITTRPEAAVREHFAEAQRILSTQDAEFDEYFSWQE